MEAVKIRLVGSTDTAIASATTATVPFLSQSEVCDGAVAGIDHPVAPRWKR